MVTSRGWHATIPESATLTNDFLPCWAPWSEAVSVLPRAGLGGAKMALAIAVKYALKRRQFNDSIKMQEDLLMDYPTHQLRLTPLVASAYVYHVTLDKMMESYCDASQPDKRKVETQVAGLKAIITWYANSAIQECREACGGKGYLIENRIADLKGDVDIFTTFEGDNNVLLLLAAKGVLSDFKAEFNSAGFTSVLKLLSTQIAKSAHRHQSGVCQ